MFPVPLRKEASTVAIYRRLRTILTELKFLHFSTTLLPYRVYDSNDTKKSFVMFLSLAMIILKRRYILSYHYYAKQLILKLKIDRKTAVFRIILHCAWWAHVYVFSYILLYNLFLFYVVYAFNDELFVSFTIRLDF